MTHLSGNFRAHRTFDLNQQKKMTKYEFRSPSFVKVLPHKEFCKLQNKW